MTAPEPAIGARIPCADCGIETSFAATVDVQDYVRTATGGVRPDGPKRAICGDCLDTWEATQPRPPEGRCVVCGRWASKPDREGGEKTVHWYCVREMGA